MSEPELSFLDSLNVSNKSVRKPFFLILYGAANVGKSGMCLNAPSPFFVALESGTDWLPAPKFVNGKGEPIAARTVDQAYDMLKWLLNRKNRDTLASPVETVIFDSLGFFEAMIYSDIIKKYPLTTGKNPVQVKSIVDLGYDGMGYAIDYWQRLLSAVESFKKQGINVIFITHSTTANTTSPDGKSYKEIVMALQKYGKHDVPELLARACDYCYYMSSEIETTKVGAGTWAKNVATAGNTSRTVITTRRTSLFFAKTRPINEELIPDNYYYDIYDRNDVQKQIFNDILFA